jgi:hypothetical protein
MKKAWNLTSGLSNWPKILFLNKVSKSLILTELKKVPHTGDKIQLSNLMSETHWMFRFKISKHKMYSLEQICTYSFCVAVNALLG